ncbi:MAG: hypothetical protein QMC38_09325 [Sinobacterium sp.]
MVITKTGLHSFVWHVYWDNHLLGNGMGPVTSNSRFTDDYFSHVDVFEQ